MKKNKEVNLTDLVMIIQEELAEMKRKIEVNLNVNQNHFLESVLVAQEQMTRLEEVKVSSSIISLSKKQLLSNYQKLIELGISVKNLGLICQAKETLTNLEIEQEQKMEAKIEFLLRK